jgi:hypothetical protein
MLQILNTLTQNGVVTLYPFSGRTREFKGIANITASRIYRYVYHDLMDLLRYCERCGFLKLVEPKCESDSDNDDGCEYEYN